MIPLIHSSPTVKRIPIFNAIEMLQLVIGTWSIVLYNQYISNTTSSIQDSAMNTNMQCLLFFGIIFLVDTLLQLTISICNYLLESKQTVLFEVFDMAAVCARIGLNITSMYLLLFLVRHLPSANDSSFQWNQIKLFSSIVLAVMSARWVHFACTQFGLQLPSILFASKEQKKIPHQEPISITSSA